MISRPLKVTAALLVLCLSITGCSNFGNGAGSSEPEVERNVFTNLPGANGKVLAVKFDDTNYAHPQQGVENADIVFVTQVEAGLTRLMGIYSSNYPELLGPIRSARISDLDILAQFGRVGFLYSGAQSKLRPVIAAANVENLSAERNPPTIYFNDPARNAPYAMMVKPNLLLEKNPPINLAKSIGWEHGDSLRKGRKFSSAIVSWPNAEYAISWSKADKRFLLQHNGRDDIAASGQQLGSPMMVVQNIEITPSEYGDKFGGITPKSHVVGSGDAYLFRNGRVIKAKWSRDNAISPTTWTLQDGSPAYFAPGQVWVFLADQKPAFTFPAK